MDGIHDMGGMHGFGAVPTDAEEVFVHDWQKRAFALCETVAWAAPFNSDQHRHAIERMPPAAYLTVDYFEKWAIACRMLLLEAGLVDAGELENGEKRFELSPGDHTPVGAAELIEATHAGAPMSYPEGTASPAFQIGTRVRVSRASPAGHTRAPRYVRGQVGVIETDLGVFQFADAMARGDGPNPQHCYTVRFEARDLWGDAAEAGTSMRLDLWEAYLDPA